MGLGPKNNIRNLHEEFDNHKIMVIETVSALNKLLFFEKYWSTEQKHVHWFEVPQGSASFEVPKEVPVLREKQG